MDQPNHPPPTYSTPRHSRHAHRDKEAEVGGSSSVLSTPTRRPRGDPFAIKKRSSQLWDEENRLIPSSPSTASSCCSCDTTRALLQLPNREFSHLIKVAVVWSLVAICAWALAIRKVRDKDEILIRPKDLFLYLGLIPIAARLGVATLMIFTTSHIWDRQKHHGVQLRGTTVWIEKSSDVALFVACIVLACTWR